MTDLRTRRRVSWRWLCLWLAWLPAAADELNVAVAANFLSTLQQLAPKFQQASGHRLVISSGSTGQLYAQIKQGAPFDLFLSADGERPRLLESEGLGVPGSRATYAIGTLVLWSPRPEFVDANGKVLQSAQVRMIAIADPKNAPYGAAAQQVLTARGVWDEFNRDHKIAMAENINQAWQFAATGNAQLAFIAKSQLSTLSQDGKPVTGSSWEPPQSLYTEIDQDGLVLTRSTKQAAAESFMRWLRADTQAIAVITAAGYRVRE
ncbi:MAG TPA: molybdate ABC transporter substrate-binding protein [Steroidobacteraceae bacterium]|jgi:molybdate transport system substrate-binding protein|nr:molybdate ABC transporter substrate-binding protein [Steroidobacteraceae bacterium]